MRGLLMLAGLAALCTGASAAGHWAALGAADWPIDGAVGCCLAVVGTVAERWTRPGGWRW